MICPGSERARMAGISIGQDLDGGVGAHGGRSQK